MTLEAWFKAAEMNDLDYLSVNLNEFSKRINKAGYTALMLAVLNGNNQCVSLLCNVEAGCTTVRSDTALFLAIKSKNIEAVELLAALEYCIESHNALPIFHCLNFDFLEATYAIAPYCRSRDNYVNRFGETPYTRSIEERRLGFIEALGSQFGDIEDDFEIHPVVRALEASDVQVVSAVYSYSVFNPNRSLLIEAFEMGLVLFSELLFEEYAKIVGNDSKTALMALCAERRKNEFTEEEIETVDVLAREEAGMEDKFGFTALMYAVKTGKQQLIELLAHREQKIGDNHGHTALMKAVIYENVEAVRLLRTYEKGLIDKCDNTALKMAVELDEMESVELLEDEIVEDCGQNNAIERAVVKGNQEAIERLGAGFLSESPEQKSDYFEITAKVDLMQSMRDVIRLGGDYEEVRERITERHCGWDDL